MLYFASDRADKTDEMTPNPRCSWRAFVVVTAVLIAPVATTRAAAADAASSAPAATQPTTERSSRAAATAKSPGGATNASTVAVIADERADWSGTMNQLATLLAGKDLPALQQLLRPSPIIRPFSSDALQTHERLLGATTGSTVLGVHAYDKPPTTLATDLSNDFANAPADVVPQNVRERMVPRDEAAARRANETAAEWLVQVLQPDKHEATGVIVLWPPTRGRSIAAAPRRATFVLVKGENVDGLYVLRQITFGDPLETPQ
jgi:hypothetical protein